MTEEANNKDTTSVRKLDEARDGLRLELKVQDPIVAQYLADFEEPERSEKALEALKVGVIAIRSASPALDTRIVEEKFAEVEKKIVECVGGFDRDVRERLEKYFREGSGAMPRSLEDFLGRDGKLSQLFARYFGPDDSRVLRLLEEQLGSSSFFARSLDPGNKESVISRIEEAVQKHLEEKTSALVKEFSLDIEGSALVRLKEALSKEVREIARENSRIFEEMKERFGAKTAQEIEAEKGTEKGRRFEETLYDRLAELGRQLEDETEAVGEKTGALTRSKVGDYVITLGPTSGAPGKRLVVEAKKRHGVKIQDAVDEIRKAKENREAECGIFVFEKGYEPAEVGDFRRMGGDFYVTVDKESLESGRSLLFFEAAYKIARVLLVTSLRQAESHEVDLHSVRSELDAVTENVERMSEMLKKVQTIKRNSEIIEKMVTDLKENLEGGIDRILGILNRSPEPGGDDK